MKKNFFFNPKYRHFQKIPGNPGQMFLESYSVLVQVSFIISKTEIEIGYKEHYITVAQQIFERVGTYDFRKKGKFNIG